jgi:hypothetical protein
MRLSHGRQSPAIAVLFAFIAHMAATAGAADDTHGLDARLAVKLGAGWAGVLRPRGLPGSSLQAFEGALGGAVAPAVSLSRLWESAPGR